MDKRSILEDVFGENVYSLNEEKHYRKWKRREYTK